MSGYVFHCTPCGIAHAGECPPKARDPFYAGPGSFETVELPQILGRAARGGVPQLYVPNNLTPSAQILPGSHGACPVSRHQGFMPASHTIWRPETRQLPTDPWHSSNTYFYEVMSAAGGLVRIAVVGGGAEYDYHVFHWSDDGHLDQASGIILRFVPAP